VVAKQGVIPSLVLRIQTKKIIKWKAERKTLKAIPEGETTTL